MPVTKLPYRFFSLLLLLVTLVAGSGCGIYNFTDASVPANVKTVRIRLIENRAQYVNPQLSPTLTERVRQRIISQTRLTQTNSDNAHYDISGTITNYSISTSGITTNSNDQRQTSMNTLTVTVHIILNDYVNGNGQPKEYDISRSFPFNASLSLQSAEAQLLDEMVRNLTDDIFNRLFSQW